MLGVNGTRDAASKSPSSLSLSAGLPPRAHSGTIFRNDRRVGVDNEFRPRSSAIMLRQFRESRERLVGRRERDLRRVRGEYVVSKVESPDIDLYIEENEAPEHHRLVIIPDNASMNITSRYRDR